jgi:UPF0755 protein
MLKDFSMTDVEEGPYPVDRSIEETHEDDHPLFGAPEPAAYVPGAHKRSQRHRPTKRRRKKIAPLLAILVIAALVAVSYVLVRSVSNHFAVADYSGTGQGFTRIQIHPGDAPQDIGTAMAKAGVVKSARAFVNAAKDSGQSNKIQPGVYRVRLKSSGKAAMAAILDPANVLVSKVTIPEGYTAKQVLAELAKKTGLPLAALTASAGRLDNLGVPDGLQAKSPEGLLFPATYDFDPAMSADAVVQTLTTKFASVYGQVGIAGGAQALGISPYQALIVASMIESEAKFDSDRAKIARVIYNRLAKKMPIGIDAVNRYGVALAGKDPNSTTFQENSPYNVRLHTGLPPTPISNPGTASLQAAVNPAAGDWLYYVVNDAAGHHLFTADEPTWAAAVDKCKANGWGC